MKPILCSNAGCPQPAVMRLSAEHPWFCGPCVVRYARDLDQRRQPVGVVREGRS